RAVAVAALGCARAAARRAAIARRHLADAAAAATTTGVPGWHASSGARVLEGLVHAGSLTTARRYATTALASAEQRGALGNTPTILRVLAETTMAQRNRWRDAERFCRDAIARAEAMEMRPARARAQLVLGRIYQIAGRPADAR